VADLSGVKCHTAKLAWKTQPICRNPYLLEFEQFRHGDLAIALAKIVKFQQVAAETVATEGCNELFLKYTIDMM